MFATLSSLVKFSLLTAAGAIGLALAAGFLGRFHPALDSFSHFRLHLAVCLGIAAAMLIAFGLFREGMVGLVLAVGAFVVTPGAPINTLLSASARADGISQDQATYRLLQFNARYDNQTPEDLVRLIAKYRPDVVTLQEMSAIWRERLATLKGAYPHQILCDVPYRTGGVAVISRRPIAEAGESACNPDGSLAVARIDFGGRTVTIASLHLRWPWPYGQAAQVRSLAPQLAALGDEAILAGDFNAVGWSETTRSVERHSGLKQAGAPGATWLSRRLPNVLRPYIGLGIDHVLAGPSISAQSLERGEFIGSDHLPLLFEFSMMPVAPEDVSTEIVRAGLASVSQI